VVVNKNPGVTNRVAMQFFDVEVLHRQQVVPDHQPGDRGLFARPKQENVADPQIDSAKHTSTLVSEGGWEAGWSGEEFLVKSFHDDCVSRRRGEKLT
jgi:hypothetical protein